MIFNKMVGGREKVTTTDKEQVPDIFYFSFLFVFTTRRECIARTMP